MWWLSLGGAVSTLVLQGRTSRVLMRLGACQGHMFLESLCRAQLPKHRCGAHGLGTRLTQMDQSGIWVFTPLHLRRPCS